MSLRVALLLHGLPAASMGGTGLYVAALADALRQAGHEVTVLAPVPDLPPGSAPRLEPRTGGVALRLSPPLRLEHTWSRPDAAAALAGWLHRWRADVLHVHHLAHGSLDLLRAGRDAGARVVLTLHDYALPCARGQLVDADLRPCPGPAPARCAACLGPQLRLDPLTAAAGRVLARWPALRSRARDRLAPVSAPRPRDVARLADRADRVAAALSVPDRLLSPSRDLADRFAAMGLRRPRVLDLPLVRPVPPAPPPGDGPLRLLFASSVIPTKGPDRLLAAFQALPAGAATLTIAGPAPAFDGRPGWGDTLREAVEATPGATWRGALPAEEVPALLAAHDVLVLPSTWPENSPLIVREALAAGLRVLIPARGGAAELAPDAPRIPAEGGPAVLVPLLEAEVARGRGRQAPRRWPTPAEHAAALIPAAYEP